MPTIPNCHKKYILSIDIGTSQIKAGLFYRTGEVFLIKTFPHDKHKIEWQSLSFLQDFSAYINQVACISISAQAPSIVPLLHSGDIGQPVFYYEQEKQCHLPPCPSVFLPKAAYHKQNYPQEYKQVQAYLTLGDYLIYLLTGTLVTSLPAQFYTEAVWNVEQIQAYQLNPDLFPAYVLWPQPVGITQNSALCPGGIPVLASNYDFLAAIDGLDALQRGYVVDRAGSSLGFNFYVEKTDLAFVKQKCPLPELGWRFYPHIRQGFNAGFVFSDFDAFLTMLSCAWSKPCAPADILSELLPSISTDQLQQKPSYVSCSFMQLWQQTTGSIAQRAQGVFTQYARILYTVLHAWPRAITHICASGGPNANKEFVDFKQRATGIPWEVSPIIHAELLGNVRAAQSFLSY